MSKAKKFGTFAGVFTPSVLTILGVIMYMRLGWVVGQAGLINTILIIFIAHLISITTGLGISSIATDKKIKTGGLYYMLSRSLGFPMGGSIGIALFIGTALSISLYLIGFAESFLAIEGIRNFLHLEQNINGFRIIGTIFLMLIAAIAFISSSLAIKSQYFILTAIALSIVSIILGFFINNDFAPTEIILTQSTEEIPLAVIFGIFFPAVTGFTAGVAMSGDLINPKRNIPFGTLGAIATGFVVYILLAIGFAYFVNRDMLMNDPNFLLTIAFSSPLVIAGIWGATLSSALGGILGGPRILQAMTKDGIGPKIFAKGHGASNEPRNALILVFILAEIGILIGELNVIASVVSMFYLASYGFINLAFFLENWASTDFRPTFKINKYFGLIGFLASFGVMFQLDMLSMFASLIIMLAIYVLLSRKELMSESGDVWQSVWLTIIRFALHKMDNKNIEVRNWQPNILLFSGGTNKRPHLIEFGKNLVGKFGLLSNFDLQESIDNKYLFSKLDQSITPENGANKGVFTRRKSCSNIYNGVETIVSTYGFSGIEPNTVLMGWARESKNPKRFATMIKRVCELDMNMVLIDYDQRYGYGEYKQIDIWWRGSGHHGNLALTLMKFITSSEKWSEANVRLMIVNPENNQASKIKSKAQQIIENLRLNAEIKIINNQIEQKSFYDIVRTHSLKSDLIVMGIPEILEGKEKEFADETNKLMTDIGTVVLLKASSQFKELNFGITKITIDNKNADNINFIISEVTENNNIDLPQNAAAAENIKNLHGNIQQINKELFNNYFNEFLSNSILLNKNLRDEINIKIENLPLLLKNKDINTQTIKLFTTLDDITNKLKTIINKYETEISINQKNIFEKGTKYYLNEVNNINKTIPEYQIFSYSTQELTVNTKDSKKERRFKKNNLIKLKFGGKTIKYKVKYKKLISSYLPTRLYKNYIDTVSKLCIFEVQHLLELQKLTNELRIKLLGLTIKPNSSNNYKEEIKELKEYFTKNIEQISETEQKSGMLLFNNLQNNTNTLISEISTNLKQINVNDLITRTKNKKTKIKDFLEEINEIPEIWHENQKLFLNTVKFEINLQEFENRLRILIKSYTNSSNNIIKTNSLKLIETVKNYLEDFISNYKKDEKTIFSPSNIQRNTNKDEILVTYREMLESEVEKTQASFKIFPEKTEILSSETFNNFTELQFKEIEKVELMAAGIVEYFFHIEFHTPVLNEIEILPEKLIEIENKAKNIIRLIAFTYFDADGKLVESKENEENDVIKFIEKRIIELDEIKTELEEEKKLHTSKINEHIQLLSGKLNIHSLINDSNTFSRYVGKYKKSKSVSLLIQKYRVAQQFSTNQINKLWFRHSQAILLKKSIEDKNKTQTTSINSIFNLIDKVSPKQEILKTLPFFYQQLFLRTYNYNNDFWKWRNTELLQIDKTIKRYYNDYSGAILIKGERFSGKTFLSQYAVHKFLPKHEKHIIKPPVTGSTDENYLKKAFTDATGIKGSYKRIFDNLKQGSVIIIEDLELWWEKSENGDTVLTKIFEIIDEYSDKNLFIVNINTYSYNTIKLINNIDRYFINIIDCKPFNAEEIKDIILFRHNSSGLKISYKNKTGEKIKLSDYAKLFAKYFNYSDGNIGVSLFYWISNISKSEQNGITIKSPQIIDSSGIENLEKEIYIILLQFLLHKRMDIPKLARVCLESEKKILSQIKYLKRTGIIVEEQSNVYTINKFIYPQIKKKLIDIDMI